MNKVLLVGDSIRMSYETLVKENLHGIAEVVSPEENCRFAKYTLWEINGWIEKFGKPDIIHWNNGIWDIYHLNEAMGIFTPIKEYEMYIARILQELRKTMAEIIWATTTPVNNKCITCNNRDINEYNAAIMEFMRTEHIAINDLNAVVKENIDVFIDAEDYVHLTPEGQIICSQAVTKAIKCYI